MRRRVWLAACAAAGLLPAAARAAADRATLVMEAQAALAQGRTAAALAGFEHAASMAHEADIELGIVHAQLQQGEYRRALGFAAHVAGGHADEPAASALYAWLLAVGGQPAVAQGVLARALAQAGQDRLLIATQALLAQPGSTPDGALLARPHRLAPEALLHDGATAPPVNAIVLASGLLLDDGQQALLPWPVGADAESLWVRNGLGQTTMARLARRLHPSGLALATLAPALPGGFTVLAPGDPHAGSAGHVVSYAAGAVARPAWPWLHAGFIGGRSSDSTQPQRLGIEVPRGVHGAPVFDAAGRCCGIALDGTAQATLVSPHTLLGNETTTQQAAAKQPLAEVYEHALPVALQVISKRR
jgi:hypothetical protein